jgi:hypothetical protein
MQLEPTQVSDEEDKLMPSLGAKVANAAGESEKEIEEDSSDIGDTKNRARHCKDRGKLTFLN